MNASQESGFHVAVSIFSGSICILAAFLWYARKEFETTGSILIIVPVCVIVLCDVITALNKKFKIASVIISGIICFLICAGTNSPFLLNFICIGIICGVIIATSEHSQNAEWASSYLFLLFLFVEFAYEYHKINNNATAEGVFFAVVAVLIIILIFMGRRLSHEPETNIENQYLLKHNFYKLGTPTNEMIELCQKYLSVIPDSQPNIRDDIKDFIEKFRAMRNAYDNDDYYEKGFIIENTDTYYVEKVKLRFEQYNQAMQDGKNENKAAKQLEKILFSATWEIGSTTEKIEDDSIAIA